MSRHKECGETIRWARRPEDDRWMPPLEYAGQVFIFLEGSDIATQTAAYRYHDCDPARILAWQAYLKKLEEVKGEHPEVDLSNSYQAGRELDRQGRLEFGQRVACPNKTCPAKIGEPCINLAILKRTGEMVETREPHPERTKLAEKKAKK